jgi:pilus assembly protein CpaF
MPKEKYTWEYLKDNHMLDDDMIEYLKDRVVSGYGFLISGRGGSGKSTLLNNLIDFIPFNESVLVSQESDELYSNVHPQIQFEHIIETPEIVYGLDDELKLGLLQDIDNFVIGEIKSGEALYVFTTAMSTGARFFGTIHSNDAIGSVLRLAQCAKYVSDYSVEALEEMLTTIPFVLIHMSNFSIDEIVEITGWDSANKCLIYKHVYKKENVEPTQIDGEENVEPTQNAKILNLETKNVEPTQNRKPEKSAWSRDRLDEYKEAAAAFH